MIAAIYREWLKPVLGRQAYLLLTLIVASLQLFKQVKLETLVENLPLPILSESRRKLCRRLHLEIRARTPKGKRALGKRPQKRGKNVSVIGAIGLQGVLAHMAVMGSVDKLTFEAFIACKLVPKLWAGADVIMDNAAISF
ncbi:transposase [Trichothermofontia sichuanensis B231]|uniref:transposase n=1 Tax=Trichothermofontia sichuanensis TaxID=3045816 RepID=UPI00224564A5|nr:transposase [Trichothermofontia sichuanensis]UZQ55228.1 transposase [Trichothermofontia sichuanensis B231]